MAANGLAELIEAAKPEGDLVGVGLTDPRSMGDILWKEFRQTTAPWADLRYEQDVFGGRVLARAESAEPPDFMVVGNPVSFDEQGLLEPLALSAELRRPRPTCSLDGVTA